MPETFTLNETPADAPELNADEQESLALADSMEQGENGLLAGKYNSVEELERGYLEAQKMIGGDQEEVFEEQDLPSGRWHLAPMNCLVLSLTLA